MEDADFFETWHGVTEDRLRQELEADAQKPLPFWWYRSSIGLTGMLFGGAVGDSFGQTAEGRPVAELARTASGDMADSCALGVTTACTRRSLLFAEAMVCGHVALRREESVDLDRLVSETYRRWLQVEGVGSGASGGWLLSDSRLRGDAHAEKQMLNALALQSRGEDALDRFPASRVLAHAAPLTLFWDRSFNPRPERSQEKLLAFGIAFGGQTHTSPVERLAIATLPLLARRLPSDQTVLRALSAAEYALHQVPGHERVSSVVQRVRQLHQDEVDPVPAVEQLAREFDSDSALGVLAIAVYAAAHGNKTSFANGLAVSVLHDGDRLASSTVCGQIMGMNQGPAVIPRRWLEQLDVRDLVEQIASDVVREVGPHSPVSDEWFTRYSLANSHELAPPTEGATPAAVAETQTADQRQSTNAPPPDPHERFHGSMLAGAMGDALGYAIEFNDIGMIRRHHGENGLVSPVLRNGVAQISDDTQMMLFTLEGLIRAHVARRIEPRDNDPIPEVQHAYQRWFHTQSQSWQVAGGPFARQLQRPDGWLITNPELFSNRAPGNTCMSALANFAQTGVFATPQNRVNDSKGCGGVMRAAPAAAWSNDPSEVFLVAVRTAALTHSHPSGFLSAGVLAVIVHQLIREVPLRESVRLARELLTRWPQHEEQLQVLDRAVGLAERGRVSPEELKGELGEGWVGEEALAIGLYAVLATDNLRDALLLSVNHSGDSDSTGIVCGNIGGALYGTRGIPQDWLQQLELREVIETITNDMLAEFSPGPPTDPSWTQRYPAW
ncbi:ADP-ribosylglycohydrolase family protein [Saccharopolyspora dendranthemae]|uniref:ADP-ribosylglycohydrolase n=1 Tax=Saccharopolyspora dendranthemae TaxID=1181886 RepID=A0A561U1A6_9PSEU|nr:ADP-ribosylglycohydrolase family protein [Saccharopolyspora dendranthemae]TWF93138.1 ADP-ribosylglycohydrolase [Saccharopolyspora dendranthemae]